MKRKIFKSFAMVFVCATLALGCATFVGCGDDTIKVNSITLNKNTITLMEKNAEQLVATVDPNNANVTWSTADSTKVIVDQTGKVTAISASETPVIITAKAGDKSATCAVFVTKFEQIFEDNPFLSFSADELTEEKDHAYTEETNLKNNMIFITAQEVTDEGKVQKTPIIGVEGSKTFDEDTDKKTYTKFIKTQGKGSKNNASIKLVLDKGAKIIMHCRNASSTLTEMPVSFFNSNYQKIEGQTYNVTNDKNARPTLTFTASNEGTYYIGTETGSLNVYGIYIYYQSN